MIIGIDFDNTIIKYDELFHKISLERNLIPSKLIKDKNTIRNYLREHDKEHEWTLIQGEVYGERIEEAMPFPGMKKTILELKSMNIPLKIISHKTKFPYLGPKRDLHKAALKWLSNNEFFSSKLNFKKKDVFFETTKEKKVERIISVGCTHYIDDLPEILKMIPSAIKRINFSQVKNSSEDNFIMISKWNQLLEII